MCFIFESVSTVSSILNQNLSLNSDLKSTLKKSLPNKNIAEKWLINNK